MNRLRNSQVQKIETLEQNSKGGIWFGFMSENHRKIFNSFENKLQIKYGKFKIIEENVKIKPVNIFAKILYLFTFLYFYLIKQKKIAFFIGYYWYRSRTLKSNFEKFIKVYEPSVIILFKGENYQSKIVGIEASKRNIKTIVIQHGLLGANKELYKYLTVDEYWVWGEIFKERLSESSIDKIVITGNPKTDILFEEARKCQNDKNEINKILVLPNSGSSVTSFDNVQLLLDSIIFFASKYSNISIEIKPHPADYSNNVLKYLNHLSVDKQFKNIIILEKEKSPEFSTADLVAINNSASGLESSIFGLPLILSGQALKECLVPQYLNNGGAIFANSKESFIDAFNLISINYPYYRNQIKKNIDQQLSFQGDAANQIVELINKF